MSYGFQLLSLRVAASRVAAILSQAKAGRVSRFTQYSPLACVLVSFQAWATTPTIAGSGNSQQTTDVTSHTVAVGSPSSGDLVVVIFTLDGTSAPTWPMGWNVIGGGTSNSEYISVAYKVADGTEGASITVTSGSGQESNHRYYRLTGHDSGQAPQGTCTLFGTATVSLDPPNVTPTGGAKDYLWIAAAMWDSGPSSHNGTYPTNYINTGTINSGSGGTGLAWGTRALNASSENPSAFGISPNGLGAACTIAIHPVSAVPPTFDTGVAYVSATTTAMTVSFDASSDAVTYYCDLYPAGATPTAAQVKAGTNGLGVTASGSTTGSSQQVSITADAAVHPFYEPHCVLENPGGLSSVSDTAGSLANTPMAPPSTCGAGADEPCQFVGITSVAMESACAGFNALTDPDIANGDVLVAPVAVQPSGLVLEADEDCSLGYSPGPGDPSATERQSALNIKIFDASAVGYHADDIDAWFNNKLPSCNNSTRNLRVNSAFSLNVASLCTDDDDDLGDLTVAEDTDPMITGLTFSDPTVSGTPTVLGESGTGEYTVTDIPGDEDALSVDFSVIQQNGGVGGKGVRLPGVGMSGL